MTSSWVIRAVRAGDEPDVACQRYAGARELGEVSTESAAFDLGTYANWLSRRLRSRRYIGYVAEISLTGEIVSHAAAVVLAPSSTGDVADPRSAQLSSVYTVPPWRRRGIAQALLKLVFGECRIRGVQRLHLPGHSERVPLYRQFSRCGRVGARVIDLDAIR